MTHSDTLRMDFPLAAGPNLNGKHQSSSLHRGSMENSSVGLAQPIGQVAEEALSDTIVVPEMLRPVDAAQQREAVVDSVLKRDIWWENAVEDFDRHTGTNYGENWEQCVILPEDGKEAGDLLPYRVTTDDYIVSALLLCFFIAAFFVARSQHFFMVKAKEFLRSSHRENLFNDSSDERMMGKFFFPFVLTGALSVLMFDYQQMHFPKVVNAYSPYLLIGLNFVIFGVAYVLRTLLYKFVNTVFFEREKYVKWIEAYHLLTVAGSACFFLIALLVVFYELDFENWKIMFYISVIFVEIFLIFKTYHIFFKGLLGSLHLILYLCTLEFLPLLTLWKGAVWVTQELTRLV